MKQYEASAKTVEEAIELGLQELGVSIGDVDVQVVEEGSKGLFGLFGSRPVKVRLTVKDSEEDPLADLLEDKKPAKAKKEPEKKPEKKPVEKKAEEKKPAPEKKKAEKKPEPAAEKKETAAKSEKPAAKPEIRPMEKPEVTMIPAEELDAESPAGIAHTFLMEMTKLMGVDVTIDMGTDADGNVYGYINGDTLGILIGRRGETLDAVQYLTSLKVNRGREGYIRVTLDTENYRAKREDTLIRLANRMANRALRTGRKVSLEPMNPYERRIIHYALQQTSGVTTHSEGEEPNRHVVITNKK
ncbi:MAG: protein jag [Clostridia bacterium]|nr:protein jag [Clostridia bacterium]